MLFNIDHVVITVSDINKSIEIFENNLGHIQLASILTLLSQKKESFEEIFAFTQYLKKKCKKIDGMCVYYIYIFV